MCVAGGCFRLGFMVALVSGCPGFVERFRSQLDVVSRSGRDGESSALQCSAPGLGECATEVEVDDFVRMAG